MESLAFSGRLQKCLSSGLLAFQTDEGSPDGNRVVWRTPEALYPSLSIVDVSVGLNGQLLEQPAAEMKGYTVQKRDSVFQIGVPFDADGRVQKVRRSVGVGT